MSFQSLTLKDFRCFHEEQTARLAPLTLLVGENSTGKTSFMAMIRALLEYAVRSETPISRGNPTILEALMRSLTTVAAQAGAQIHSRGGSTQLP